MSDLTRQSAKLPPEQAAIRAKCFHPAGTFVEFPEQELDQSIAGRFEKMVSRYPERQAVKTKNGAVTYDELNKTANRLAREIVARQGQGQEPVALCLADGVQLISAHLAVLKAGKFSLGLDPAASPSRTAHLLNDSQAAVVITEGRTDARARQWAKGKQQLINMDELDADRGEENLGWAVSADAYAYLRYTSGSTGQAKGGLKTHRHVMHAVRNATNCFHICPDDRSTLLTRDASLGKYAFDVLLNGAALCPFYVKDEGFVQLADWLIQQQVTFYYSFPTAFRHFASALSEETYFPHLRLIRLEGEPVYRSDVELYKQRFRADCLLANSFSSTETGPICVYFVDQQADLPSPRVPAGYPVAGMQVLLLDEFSKEVGPAQSGEVAVQSCFLSSGYWQRPELTQTKFLSAPTREENHIYCTGDVGRWLDDGCLELLGRKDFQVKIRSFRVDVGEVEAALAVHPEIKEVTVISQKDQFENTRLIAYLVARRQPAPTTTTLRNFLKARLPDYMIPAAFVAVDKFPLLSTGKVDRRALPDAGTARPELDTPYVEPRTGTERELARIWKEVLGRDHVGVDDNFFDLGGHSLAATRIISQLIKTLQLEVPLQALFEAPTVAEMAMVVTQNQANRVGEAECTRILAELEAMSEDEARIAAIKIAQKG